MGGRKRKKPASYYKKCAKQPKVHAKERCLDKDMLGFLITCDRSQERGAVRDAYSLLNKYADLMYGEEKFGKADPSDEEESEEEDVDEALTKEITAMKETKPTERRFQQKESGAKQVVFIKTLLEKPNELMEKILEDISTSENCQSRNILRMMPVVGTCKVTDDIGKDIGTILEPFLANGKEFTYCLNPKIRNNDNSNRMKLIMAVGGEIQAMNEKAVVEFNNPEYMIFINIIKNVACVSLLKDFLKYKKYNLQEIVVKQFSKEIEDKVKEGTFVLDVETDTYKAKSEMEGMGEVCTTEKDEEGEAGEGTPQESSHINNEKTEIQEEIKSGNQTSIEKTEINNEIKTESETSVEKTEINNEIKTENEKSVEKTEINNEIKTENETSVEDVEDVKAETSDKVVSDC